MDCDGKRRSDECEYIIAVNGICIYRINGKCENPRMNGDIPKEKVEA